MESVIGKRRGNSKSGLGDGIMQRKHVVILTLALFAVLIVRTQLALVQADGVVVGVSTGNWFEYQVLSMTGNGTEFSNGASNFTVDVYLVTGSLVRFQEDIRYPNGTEPIITGYTDVSNGSSETERSWMIVSSNLQAGDPVYSSWNWIINKTVAVDGRETNYLSVENAYLNNSGQSADVNATMCYDQATGVVLNATVSARSLSDNFQFNETYALIAQNVWTSLPEFSPTILAATILTLTAFAAVACSKKGKAAAP